MNIKVENLDNIHLSGIYSITNTINGKRYIGSTAKKFKTRWKQHHTKLCKGTHHCQHLQNAWNKDGEDAFVFEIIEIVSEVSILRDREQYYIQFYNTVEDGYNLNPDPHCSPMLNGTTQKKVSHGLSLYWKKIKNTLSPEEYKEFCMKKSSHTPWNKGIIVPEEIRKTMRKPKVNGISDKMREHNKKTSQFMRDRSDYIMVYDINGNWLNTFRSIIDLVEYSKTEFNDLPIIVRAKGTKTLNDSKICTAITENKSYKGLFFKRVPKDRKLPCANGMNSWKAEKPIMSQAEDTSSEGAETTGEVKSS